MRSLRTILGVCIVLPAVLWLGGCSGAAPPDVHLEDAAAGDDAGDENPVVEGPGSADASTDAGATSDGHAKDSAVPGDGATQDAQEASAQDATDETSPADAGPADSGSPEAASCPAGDLTCSGQCVPSDVHHCGACGHDCTALAHVSGSVSCSATGQCIVPATSCAAGWAHCSANPDDGCETNVTTDSQCGTCTDVCPANLPHCSGSGGSYVCVSGCPAGTPTLCGATCTDTTGDPAHCGSCGDVCTTGVAHAQATCAASACGFACNAGYSACGATCVDFGGDGANCGGCGHVCGGGETCQAGHCACPAGETLCGSACTATSSDNANCGACGHACTGGESCQGGACTCPTGQTFCGGACTSTSSDGNNCGACGVTCTGGETCQAGACACPTGEALCGGVCVSEGSDAANCGACGHGCLGGACSAGQCQPVTLTTFPGGGVSVSLDPNNVYFTSNAALYSCPKTGCPGPKQLAPLRYGQVLYDPSFGGYLYVTQSSPGQLTQYTVGGTWVTGGPLAVAGPLASDADNVYVGYYLGMLAAPKAPAYSSTQVIASNAPATIASIAVDPQSRFVYGGTSSEDGQIIRAQGLGSGSWATYIANQVRPVSIAFAAGNVYWANLGSAANQEQDGSFYMCAAGASCPSPTLLKQGTSCATVTADASHLYFADAGGVYECPLSGCGGGQRKTLAAGPATASGATMTSDATALYWVTLGGALMKLAK